MSFQHSRSGSSDSAFSASRPPTPSPYQLILDHIFTYPGTFEIPLSTMYSLNCASRAQHTPARSSASSSSSGASPGITQQSWHDQTSATHEFTQNLMAQVSQLPNQPHSLPPSFIIEFLRKCFPAELLHVDFPSALKGLDYLKDLETRRRREVAAALERLNINRSALMRDDADLAQRYPVACQWLKTVEEKERKVEAQYTQLYISLRRWLLINEMSLLPFHKQNCMAMLNTLYPPPMGSSPPTSKLTPDIIKTQRNGFFSYINQVEKKGPRVLHNLMEQGKAPMDDNGWPAVTRILGLYLHLASNILDECADIQRVEDITPRKSSTSTFMPRRKADSGVSFTSTNSESFRPPTRSSAGEPPVSPTESVRPKTPSNSRSGTTLEKLARGLISIGIGRTDATETIIQDPTPVTPKARGLRKMRSMGSIGSRKQSRDEAPSFDAEEMRRQRMRYESNNVTSRKTSVGTSHEI